MNYINICNRVKHLSRDKTVNRMSKRHKQTFFWAKLGNPKYELSHNKSIKPLRKCRNIYETGIILIFLIQWNTYHVISLPMGGPKDISTLFRAQIGPKYKLSDNKWIKPLWKCRKSFKTWIILISVIQWNTYHVIRLPMGRPKDTSHPFLEHKIPKI